jgi:hypothetical protein
MIASVLWYLFPIWILLFFVLLLGVFAILSRIRGGRYVRPIITGLMKVPLLGRGLTKLSESAMERSNPLLSSAIKKLERAGAMRDPQRMQKALSLLTSAERRAWMEAADQQQQASGSGVSNRQLRRQMERQGVGQGQGQGQNGKARPKRKRGLLGRRKKEEEEPQNQRRGQRPGQNRKKRRRR